MGRGDLAILSISLAVMLCIAVPTILAALLFGWWFRSGNARARRRPDFVYSGRIEIIVWSIPLLAILFLGGVAWAGSHLFDPYRPLASKTRPLEVQVIALDWKWLFIYPQYGVATVNELPIPAGVPVHFTITSSSVMNGFFIPQLGSMVYAMNGMATQVSLQADRPGRFHGLSSNLSGDGFADMHFDAVAVPPAAFAAWAGRARQRGGALDRAAYLSLARQSSAVKPFTYGAVEKGLFDAVVNRDLPPGPGPSLDTPSARVSPRRSN